MDFLAAILFLGCTLNCSGVTLAAVPARPELKQVFLTLQTLEPKEAAAFLQSQGFVKGERASRKMLLFTGRLDGDSLHVLVGKKRRKSGNVTYRIEIIKTNFNWYQVKNHIYGLEFKLKDWLDKSPVYRVTQAPKTCLGTELQCLKQGKMEYRISWRYSDTEGREVLIDLYLNERGNMVINNRCHS